MNMPSSPIGQFIRQERMPSVCSISSISSNGFLQKRSSLLTNVNIGIPRIRHMEQLFGLRFHALGASISMTAQSAAVSVRYVSSLKS